MRLLPRFVDFNEADKKISLSIRALLAPEPAEKKEEASKDDDADVVSVDIDAVIAAEDTCLLYTSPSPRD